MKKRVLLGMMFCLVMAAGTARAEHKLLVTEILDQKQMEAQAKFEYLHSAGDMSEGGAPGKRTVNILESNYSLGVGLGHDLEVTASIPYVLSERVKEEVAETKYENRDGVGDFGFGGKYRLLDEEKEPLSLVVGLDMKFDTAGVGNAGTQTTDVSPYLAASKKLNPHFTPYGIYRATLRNNGREDTHTVSLGAEMELNETVTFDARFDAGFNTSADKSKTFSDILDPKPVKGFQTYNFDLGTYIQVCHNLYLIPSVRVIVTSATDSRDEPTIHFNSSTGVGGGMSLYYLF